jgi:hypothetical protein
VWLCVPCIVFSYCLFIRCNHWRWSLITFFARHHSSPGWYGEHTIYNHHFQARTCEGCWQVIWGDTQKQGEPNTSIFLFIWYFQYSSEIWDLVKLISSDKPLLIGFLSAFMFFNKFCYLNIGKFSFLALLLIGFLSAFMSRF